MRTAVNTAASTYMQMSFDFTTGGIVAREEPAPTPKARSRRTIDRNNNAKNGTPYNLNKMPEMPKKTIRPSIDERIVKIVCEAPFTGKYIIENALRQNSIYSNEVLRTVQDIYVGTKKEEPEYTVAVQRGAGFLLRENGTEGKILHTMWSPVIYLINEMVESGTWLSESERILAEQELDQAETS